MVPKAQRNVNSRSTVGLCGSAMNTIAQSVLTRTRVGEIVCWAKYISHVTCVKEVGLTDSA